MSNNKIKIGNVEFAVTAETFRTIANLNKYSRNVSILKGLLGANILVVGAIVVCTATGVVIPNLLGVTIASILGCGFEFGLLNYNYRNEKVASKLKNHFADSVRNRLNKELGENIKFSTNAFKLERISPYDGRKNITMTCQVGPESDSREETIECDVKVGPYVEVYRVSSGSKTLGYIKATTTTEPVTQLSSDESGCSQSISASKPKFTYEFVPYSDSKFVESLEDYQQQELSDLENGIVRRNNKLLTLGRSSRR